MIAIGWYLLKVVVCSGILCGYYFLSLRNKVFHRWNRFYLLATIFISCIVPMVKFTLIAPGQNNGTIVQMLQTITYGDETVVEMSRSHSLQFSMQTLFETAYLMISGIFLFCFFLSLKRIYRLKQTYPRTRLDGIDFVNTDAKGTPFSFFRNIFWNNAIDLESKTGQHIFHHEVAHVKERHSYDKILINIALLVFWINPFFWLIRKELYMIHEFIADQESLNDEDVNAFAEMILQSVYPGRNFSITNNFFYSPLKRRLLMLAKNKHPKATYIGRLLVLPLIALIFFGFSAKVKKGVSNGYLGNSITVVIDPAHGGDDPGAVAPDGTKEKDLTLSIAKKIAALNSNPRIQILLSRNDDDPLSPKNRVEFARNSGAALFISIHANSSPDKQLSGFSVLTDKNNGRENVLFSSTLISELRKSYKTEDRIGIRKNGVWVVDHNICPAALVECGYLSNPADLAFISKTVNQDVIARDILKAINVYAGSSQGRPVESRVKTQESLRVHPDSVPITIQLEEENSIKLNQVKKAQTTDNEGASEKVPNAETRKDDVHPPSSSTALTKAQVEASFPGGLQGWMAYISKVITDSISKFGEADYGTCLLQFIVNKDGSVTDVVPKTMKGTHLARVAVNAIRNGPVWIPASENGQAVRSYRLQPVTLRATGAALQGNPVTANNGGGKNYDKIFTGVDHGASFPGGLTAWSKYISRALIDSIDKFTSADYGTCVVKFIVDRDGKVSDVEATTMKGSELAMVSVQAIKNGPRWIPASQNGRIVTSYRLQPITLANPDQKNR